MLYLVPGFDRKGPGAGLFLDFPREWKGKNFWTFLSGARPGCFLVGAARGTGGILGPRPAAGGAFRPPFSGLEFLDCAPPLGRGESRAFRGAPMTSYPKTAVEP